MDKLYPIHNLVNTLQSVKTLLQDFHPFFPTYAAILTLGGIYASISLSGSKVPADKGIKVFVFAGFFSSGPIKLAINPSRGANGAGCNVQSLLQPKPGQIVFLVISPFS
jgi:hypothetical protein